MRDSRFRSLLFPILLACAGGWLQAATPQESSRSAFDLLPADTTFSVAIPSFEKLTQQADQFLMGVWPMGVSMMVSPMLSEILGAHTLQNLDLSREVVFFGVPDPRGGPEAQWILGLLLPVRDFQAWIPGGDDAQGLSETILGTGSEPNAWATPLGHFALVLPEQSRDMAAQVKASMLASDKPRLTSTLDPSLVQQAREATLWGFADVQKLLPFFLPVIEESLSAMQGMEQDASMPVPFPHAMMQFYFNWMQSLLQDLNHITLSLALTPEKLALMSGISTLPGSPLAANLGHAPVEAASLPLLGLLPADAVSNTTGHLNTPLWKFIAIQGIKQMQSMSPPLLPAEAANRMQSLAESMHNALGTSFTNSLTSESIEGMPYGFRYVLQTRDQDQFHKTIRDMVAFAGTAPIQELVQSLGMSLDISLQENAGQIDGLNYHEIRCQVQTPFDSMSWMGMPQKEDPKAQVYRYALVDGYALFTSDAEGGHSLAILRDRLAGLPAAANAEIQQALQYIPASAGSTSWGTYNYVRMLTGIGNMGALYGSVPSGLPALNFETRSNMVYAAQVADGSVNYQVVMPKEHLMEIASAFQTLFLQAMMQPGMMDGFDSEMEEMENMEEME